MADDILDQARAWIGPLLPVAGSLDPHARAELLWAAAVTANQAGGGAAALAASQQLEPLLAEIHAPTCMRCPSWPCRGPPRSPAT